MNGTGNNILLCSHSKTGQHWILFFIANYHNILQNNATKSLGWDIVPDYAQFKSNTLRDKAMKQEYWEGFPKLRWMEYSRIYSKWIKDLFESFDKVIYLYRNPCDVMISMFYYFVNTEEGRKRLKTFDLKTSFYFQDFVEFNLPRYLSHIKNSICFADVILSYDKLRKDTSDFRKVVKLFYNEVNGKVFRKALELSSADNIKKVEKKIKKDWNPKNIVWHVRDSRSGQYKDKMSKEMINYIERKWNKLKENLKKKGIEIW